MAIYDPRLDLARSKAEQAKSPAVQTLKSVLQQQGLNTPATTNKGQKDYFSDAARKAAPQPGGFKGVLLDILGSPLGKVVTEAGKIIAIPGKVVTSGIQELADALDSDPNTNVSFNDFTKQVFDPMFGFGTVIGDLTGIKWVDRGLGLAGDIATDPLTWTTLGGSKAVTMLDDAARVLAKQTGKRIGARVTGEGGRFALAERLAQFGASPEVQKAAIRYGRSGVKDVELLAKAGVDRAGLYFMGKRIAGTTRVGEVLEKGFSGMRLWSGDHIFQKIGDAFTRADANAAITALRRGTAPSEDIAQYLHFVNSRNVERAAEAAGAREASQAEINLLGTISEADIVAARSTAYKYIEQADTLVPDVASAEGRLVGPIKQWFKQMHENVYNRAKAVDVDAPIGEVTNYFPHIHTDDAFRWMSDESNATALATRGVVYNPLDPASAWKNRMVAGQEWFGEALTEEDILGGVERLNKLARDRGGLTFDFFETDLPTVMDKYTKMYGAQIGKIARKQYLKDKGVFKAVEKRIVEDPAWVKSAEKRIATITKERAKALAKVNKKLGETTKSLDVILQQGAKDTRSKLAAALAETDLTAQSEVALQGWAKKQVMDSLEEAYIDLAKNKTALSDLSGRTDGLVASLNEQYDKLMAEIRRLSDDVSSGVARDEEITKRIAGFQKNIEAITKSEEKTINRSNIVQHRMDEINAGIKIRGHQTFADKVADVLFGPSRVLGVPESKIYGQRAVEARAAGEVISPFDIDKVVYKQAEARVKRLYKGVDKAREKLLVKLEYERMFFDKYGDTKTIKYFGAKEATDATPGAFNPQEWALINGSQPINRDRIVEAAKPENMQDIMAKALRGEASMEELRAVGIALLAGADDTMSIDTLDRLVVLLSDASNAVTLQKELDAIRRNSRGAVAIDRVVSDYNAIENKIVNRLRQHFGAITILDDIARSNVDPEAVVPLEVLYKLRNENLSLDDYFSVRIPEDYDYGQMASEAFDFADENIPTLTYRQLETELGSLVRAAQDEEYFVHFDLQEASKAGLKNNTFKLEKQKVKLKTYITGYNNYQLGEKGDGTLDNYIEEFITGRKPLTEDDILKYENELATGARPSKGRARQFTGGTARDVPEDRGADSLARRMKEIRDQYNRLNLDVTDVEGQKEINRVKRLIASGEATQDDLVIVQNQVNRKFYDEVLRPMGFGAEVNNYDESLNNLANMLPAIHFQVDVQRRTQEMVDLLSSQGIMPGKDNFLNIVNNVAKQHYGEVGHELSSLRIAKLKVDSLLETISTGEWQGREAELYDLISKEIASPDSKGAGWVDAIGRSNGRADADRIYRQMQELSVTGTKTGVVNRRAKLAQKLKDKTLGEGERAALQAQFDALPTGAALKALRDKYKKDVLRPWYLKNVDSTATKASYSEMADAIKSMKSSRTDVGRFDAEATVSQMQNWLQETSSRLDASHRLARKNSDWLRQASDPFLDLNTFTYGGGTLQNLPSMYIDSLSLSASKLEKMADELDAMVARVAKRQGDYIAAQPEDEAARLLAERMQSGRTRGQILTSRVTGAYEEFAPIINEEELAKLEIIPEDVLATLPDDAAKAKYVKNAKAKYIANAELVSKEYLKQEERALQAQRRAFQAYEEARNTVDYMGAVERKELNDLLSEFAPYSFESRTSLQYRRPTHKIATDLFNQGTPVYKINTGRQGLSASNASNPSDVALLRNLKSKLNAAESRWHSVVVSNADIADLPYGEYQIGKFANVPRQKSVDLVYEGEVIGQVTDDMFVTNADYANALFEHENKLLRSQMNDVEASLASRGGVDKLNVVGANNLSRINDVSEIVAGQRYFTIGADVSADTIDGSIIKIDGLIKRQNVLLKKQASNKITPVETQELQSIYGQIEKINREAQKGAKMIEPGPLTSLVINGREVNFTPQEIAGIFGDNKAARAALEQEIRTIQYKIPQEAKRGKDTAAYIGLKKQLADLQALLINTDPIHQQAGLQKMSDILQAVKRGELTMEEVVDSLVTTSRSKSENILAVDSSTRKTRLKELASAWTGSKDQQVYDRVAELQSDSNVSDYLVSIGKSEKARERVNNIRLEVEQLKGQYNPNSDAPFGTRRSIGKVSAKIKELSDNKPKLIQDLMKKEGISREAATARVTAEINAVAEEAGRVALNGAVKKKINVTSARFKKSVQKLIDEDGMDSAEAFNEAFIRAQRYEVETVAGAQYRYRKVLDTFRKDLQDITDSTNGEYNALNRMVELREQGLGFIEAKNTIVDEVSKLHPSTWDAASSASAVKNLREIDFNKSQIGFFERVLADDSNLSLYFVRSGKGARETMNKRIEALTEQAIPIKKMIDDTNAIMKTKEYKASRSGLEKASTTIEKKISDLEKTLFEMAQSSDLARVNRMTDAAHRTNVVAPLVEKVDRFQSLIARSKALANSSDSAEIKRLEFDSLVNDAEDLIKEYGIVQDLTKPKGLMRVNGQMVEQFGYKNTKEYDAFLRVKADYTTMHMNYMMDQATARKAYFALTHDFFNEDLGNEIWLDIQEGFTTLEKFGMPNLQARESMIPIITNMSRFRQPEFVRGVNKFLGSYTGFFKAYALSTPGFVVRNVMTNTFSMYAAGAETVNLLKGLGLYREWKNALKGGTERAFIDGLETSDRELFTLAVSASDATGYGRSGEAFAHWNPKKARLANNRYTRLFRKYNEGAEGSARFMLAYDSAVKGYDMNMATARVKRYLFDYTDVGRVDESLRGIVPFWFWMSRNFPMQIVNRFANPRPYLIYNHLMHNLGESSEGDIVPNWIREGGGVKIGTDTYLTTDLGFNKLDEQFAMFADPKRLLGYVNPGLRVPLEVLGNTHLNTGVPFSTKPQNAMGGPLSPAVDALASFFGQQTRLDNGSVGVTPKVNYAASNLFPPLGQIEGVAPSSERGQENQTNKLMSLFGIPLTIVTPGMKESQQRREVLEQNALRRRASGG